MAASASLIAGTVALAPISTASTQGELTISSPDLVVTAGGSFPYVSRYTDRAEGASLDGRTSQLDEITLNGNAHKVTGQGAVTNPSTARYKLSVADQPGVTIEASLHVEGRAMTFRIDKISDTEQFRVGTIDIPGHDLISISSAQPGAATAFTTLDVDSTRNADVIAPVTRETPGDNAPIGATYALANTGSLAAAVESNSVYDKPDGPTNKDAARFWHHARKEPSGDTRVGVWSGQWTYRAEGSAQTEELPWAKVVVTPEVNGDKKVDWQDAAVAFRAIAIKPQGGQRTPDEVVTHIPFNFASQATHPFLRTLDDIKRIALSTDGLGQRAILKGYGSEGHDSAHPDYGGNYNQRAGGLKDINTLASAAEKWNANIGVHVNATESYPEAKAFNENLVDLARKGWDWLDQSWEINQRRDNASGDLAARFAQLRAEAHPNLDFLYLDVYRSHGYVADHMLGDLRKQGWTVGTEWSNKLERSAVWSHWANDLNYGGATNKGLNSQIIRFIRNGQRDVWNSHPILGNSRIEEFEGWTGETDWNVFYDNIWANNVPAKFLQHHQIQQWGEHDITFSDGVRGTDVAGKREFYVDNAKVLDGDKYLLPWNNNQKLYHYNPSGGRTQWTLPKAFAGAGELDVYQLTDNGREHVGSVPVAGGTVTLDAQPRTAYVLAPKNAPAPPQDPRWGEGSGLADPGFHGTDLQPWNPRGSVSLARTEQGHQVAQFGAGASSIEQQIGALEPGTYSASAWVEVQPGASRRVELSVQDGDKPAATNFLDDSTAKNFVAADEKHDSNFQRMRVVFDVAARGATPRLRISTVDGKAPIRVDDVRVVRTERVAGTGIVNEDFEHVDQGWGPFVKGDAGGSTDPRTHLSERHEPFTQRGWNGKLVDDALSGTWSLKAHDENPGLVYRTVPQTVRFQPGHRYRVEFDYQNAFADRYAWITGSDHAKKSDELHATPLPEQRGTTRFSEEFTAGPDGEAWVGLRKNGGDTPLESDLIMDNFTVIDLGPA